jgi:hypothetical protein
MSAFGALLIYAVYFVLGIFCLVFLVLTFTGGRKTRVVTGTATIFFGLSLFIFKSCQSHKYEENQLSKVGLYYLTQYPGCASCVMELKEHQIYEVTSNGKIIESGDWHYEAGGDYWITFLDHDEYQLGSGKFAYGQYKLKYPARKAE